MRLIIAILCLTIVFVSCNSLIKKNNVKHTYNNCHATIMFFNKKKMATTNRLLFYNTSYKIDSFFNNIKDTNCFIFHNAKEIVSNLGNPNFTYIAKGDIHSIDSTYEYFLKNDSDWFSKNQSNTVLLYDFSNNNIKFSFQTNINPQNLNFRTQKVIIQKK